MRSEGQVRFVSISSRLQMTAAATVFVVVLALAASVAVMSWMQYRTSSDRASLLNREAAVASHEERLNAYRDDVDAVTADLKQRQDFLDAAFSSLPEDVKTAVGAHEDAAQTSETVRKVSAAVPEASALVRIEARQLAFADGLTRYADWRADRAEKALRRLGLNPSDITRNAERQAMGGPLETFFGSRGKSGAKGLDARFKQLGLSLARMTALEQGLDGVPQVQPASMAQVSSGFGFRHDPFTGEGAMHAGLDFKGPVGAPIHAAAKGTVSFVGQKSGYGNVVEIRHGNGLITRYAHMSAFKARVGQPVAPGDVIGAIGSTGRSTGPHLHFEVRINDRPVNPRTFLEQAPDVLEEIRRADLR